MTRCGCRRCSARTGTRLLEGAVAEAFFDEVLREAGEQDCCRRSTSRWTGTLLEAWASQKSFQRKDAPEGPPPEDPGNPTVDFHKEKRTNETHQSTTDPDARLARKGKGKEAKLSYAGHVLMENRNGAGGECAADPGHRHRRAGSGRGDGGRHSGPEAGDGGSGQELRRRSDGAAVAGTEGHAARGAEPGTAAQCHRQPDHTAPGLPDQPESAGRRWKRVSDG